MKRIDRNPERFEVIDLFEAMARKRGLKLNDPSSHKSFIDSVSNSLNSSKDNPIILHGRRVESMFEYVVAGLGNSILIKREDSADPKYRFLLKSSYLSALSKYATIFGRDLYIAIFWSRLRKWTLIRPASLILTERPSISFLEAFKKNEMSLLGDAMVGTTPPLSLRIVADPSKPRDGAQDGECIFTIGSVDLYCNGMRIEESLEQTLAFYFMLNSDWHVEDAKAKLEGDLLEYLEYVAEPQEPVPNQGFQILGFLSEMISRSYNDITAESGEIQQLSPSAAPGSLGIAIPKGYKGKHFPLWIFRIKPK